ncbi:7-cyano-7-deazaguanine synthase [Deinococcus pimensis]|uniref:7-cyano-7-deazaguanine synthase n=1 Tax=Deinococcus pimensis TaxID=309888 RepID=UPI0004B7B549|nr:7-cyano-7-deazaguanine synthase [Deinococcus pimensis]
MTTALLLSGGMDSVAIAFWRRPTHAFTVDYGQLAAQGEIDAAASVCGTLGITHHVLRVPGRCSPTWTIQKCCRPS